MECPAAIFPQTKLEPDDDAVLEMATAPDAGYFEGVNRCSTALPCRLRVLPHLTSPLEEPRLKLRTADTSMEAFDICIWLLIFILGSDTRPETE
jgi:hypothetical protein